MIIEISNLLKDRGKFINLNEINKYIKHAQENSLELYCSYYNFNDTLAQCNSITQYKDELYIRRIILDIDKGVNTDNYTLEKARAFYNKLIDMDISNSLIQIWYSGRGYHFSLPNIFKLDPSPDLHKKLKHICSEVFPEADNIYDKSRLIRVGNTINKKVNRYKIPLYANELLNLSTKDIQHLSSNPRTIEYPVDIEVPDLSDINIKFPIKQYVSIVQSDYTNYVTCIQKMIREGDKEGTRHINLIRIVSAYKRMGLTYEQIETLMLKWAKSLETEEVIKQVKYIWDKGYTPGCNDVVMAKYCSPICTFFKKKNYTIETKDVENLEKDFTEFISTDFSNSSINLNEIYNIGHDFNIYPGEFVMIQGDTGVNKTAFAQNIAVKTTKFDILFISLEVSQHLIFRRFIQIAHNMTKQEVINYYRNNFNNLSKKISHIKILTVAPTIDNIKKLVIEHKPKMVIIDVIDALDVQGIDITSKTESIAHALKTLANQLGIIIMGIHHISKSAILDNNGNRKSLTVHSGKGSSSLEQKCDKVLSIEGIQKENKRTVISNKARDEEPIELTFEINFDTFVFNQIIKENI